MTPSAAKELSQALKRKHADKPCPRCGHLHFSVLGELQLGLEGSGQGLFSMYKVDVPTVVVGCGNCGYLTMHAIAALRDAAAKDQPRGLLG